MTDPQDCRPVLAVLGGTFDPPHLGHVAMTQLVLSRGWAQRVVVVPCFRHPLGKTPAPFPRRLAWTRAAMDVFGERVVVSDIESRMIGESAEPAYTYDVLERLAAMHPGYRVRLLMGSDIVQREETKRWHRWADIERKYAPIVLTRPDGRGGGDSALVDVSSSRIRTWLDAAPEDEDATLALRQWVPAAVITMINAEPGKAVAVIGLGNVATHAVSWLEGRNHRVVTRSVRALLGSRPQSWSGPAPDVAWILCRDPQLPAVASAIGEMAWPTTTVVLHGAGALPSHDPDALGELADRGHPVGTLHPICSVRQERHDGSWLGKAAFGIEGDPVARAVAQTLIGDQAWLDLQALDRRGRAAYHAACALVANHWSVLQQDALSVLVREGLDRTAAAKALDVLMASALDNLLSLGFPVGVSGPAARGDEATVNAHLDALGPEIGALYRQLTTRLRALLEGAR